MFRIDNPTAAAALPAIPAAGAEKFFTEGDAGLGVPATTVDAWWLNMLQEELRALIVTGGGLAPDKADNTQVLQAIQAMIAAIPGGTLAGLSDVTLAGLANGDLLGYDGAKWVNKVVSIVLAMDDLTDAVVTAPAVGDALIFDGANWVNQPAAAAGTVVARYYFEGPTTSSSTSSLVPWDDTIPTSTEGAEIGNIVTAALADAANRIRVSYMVNGSTQPAGGRNNAGIRLNADAAWSYNVGVTDSSGEPYCLVGFYEYAPGVTTAQTIRLMYGPSAGAMYLHGPSAHRFGAAGFPTMIVEEITP